MKVTKQIFCVALIALVAFACKNTKYKKTKDGFPYKVYGSGKGEKILPGSTISYHTTSKIGDSLLGSSYGNPPQWLPIPKEGKELDDVRFFLDATKGDSILLIRPIDSLMAKNPQAAQDSFLVKNKGKEIRTYIKIVDVYKDRESAMAVQEKEAIENYLKQPENAKQKALDDAAIDAYIKANNLTTKRTSMGVAIQTVKAGNGQKAKMGDFMMLRYTGKDLTGRVFDTNDKPGGQLMPFQVGAGGMIPGFADGVKQLAEGEKAIILIPSLFAYGPQGNPQAAIAPNTSLLFDIEVVDISDKAPLPPMMPGPDTTRK